MALDAKLMREPVESDADELFAPTEQNRAYLREWLPWLDGVRGLRHGFEELELNRIELAAAVENRRSHAVPERLGMKFEGILRERENLYARLVDHAWYGILAAEWRARV